MDALLAGDIDSIAHSALFLGFELAGTSEARDALAAAIVEPSLSEMNRARAVSALADHGEPTEMAAELLMAQVREGDDDMVKNSSVLGLGQMTKRSEGDVHDDLISFLHEELAAAESAGDRVATLDAIANSQDPAFADAVSEHLRGDHAMGRSHAARALTKVAPDTARPELVAQLHVESEPLVRRTLLTQLQTLGKSQFGDQDRALAKRLLQSPRPEERSAAIDWLGKTADASTRRDLLGHHFTTEDDALIRQLIGTYLSAAELRAAQVAIVQ